VKAVDRHARGKPQGEGNLKRDRHERGNNFKNFFGHRQQKTEAASGIVDKGLKQQRQEAWCSEGRGDSTP